MNDQQSEPIKEKDELKEFREKIKNIIWTGLGKYLPPQTEITIKTKYGQEDKKDRPEAELKLSILEQKGKWIKFKFTDGPSIKCGVTPTGNLETIDLHYNWQMGSPDALGNNISDGFQIRYSHADTVYKYIDGESEDSELEPDPEIRKIINLGGEIKYLADAWFPSQKDLKDLKDLRININGRSSDFSKALKEHWIKFEDGVWKTNPPELLHNVEPDPKAWAAFVFTTMLRTIIIKASFLGENDPSNDKNKEQRLGLPHYSEYTPTRPVNLDTSACKNALEAKGLYFPWHIIEAACSSLNAGKHVIFTGPPGCGKSELALHLAEQDGKSVLPVTASPAWSTSELIGRYMPSTKNKSAKYLEFEPGFFLRAIDNGNQWLIIDELNRADIDACFGELFSVLAGQPAFLPFKESVNEGDLDEKPILILPAKLDESQKKQFDDASDQYKKYPVGADFRIIGTMNDADASRLHQLSFAFQRRFNIIRVDAPNAETMKDIIEKKLNKAKEDVRTSHTRQFYHNFKGKNKQKDGELGDGHYRYLKTQLENLFANESEDLIQERFVGVAQVGDIINFVIEGISVKAESITSMKKLIIGISKDLESLINSYIAIGVVMNVFPQLTALIDSPNQLQAALRIISGTFKNKNVNIDMYRIGEIEQHKDGKEGKGQGITVEATGRTINQYLKDELERRLQNSGINEEVFDIFEKETSDD